MATDRFYLVTEQLDLIMQVYAQQRLLPSSQQMGTCGVYELITLCTLIKRADLEWGMPKEARLFFEALVNPNYVNLNRGGIYRAYWALRNYLIENKDKLDFDKLLKRPEEE